MSPQGDIPKMKERFVVEILADKSVLESNLPGNVFEARAAQCKRIYLEGNKYKNLYWLLKYALIFVLEK